MKCEVLWNAIFEYNKSDYLKNTCRRLGMSTFANWDKAHEVPFSSLKMYSYTNIGYKWKGFVRPCPFFRI